MAHDLSPRGLRHRVRERNDQLSTMLASCIDLTKREVLSAGEHLAVVLEEGERQVEELKSLAEQFEESGSDDRFGSVVLRLRGALSCVTEFVSEITSSSNQIQANADEIETGAHELVPLASTMRDVSKKARLLAFNARVEAARGKSDEDTLVALADEMKALAHRATESATLMNGLSSVLNERLPAMSKAVRAIATSCHQSDSEVRAGDGDLERSFAHANQVIADAVASAHERSERVQTEYYVVLTKLQFQDRVEQTLQLAGSHVDRVTAVMNQVLDVLETAEDSPLRRSVLAAFERLDDSFIEDRCEVALEPNEPSADDEVGVGEMMFF